MQVIEFICGAIKFLPIAPMIDYIPNPHSNPPILAFWLRTIGNDSCGQQTNRTDDG
jgi:hypothetical protein